MRIVRFGGGIAVIAIAAFLVTACGSTPEAKSSSSPTAQATTENSEYPEYCDLLLLFNTSFTAFQMELVSAKDDTDATTRGEIAESAERLSEQALYLSEDAPEKVAAALITIGHAVVAAGERLLEGGSVLDALNEMTDDKDLQAQDTIDRHLEKGDCKPA